MPSSWTQNYYHLVFATKARLPYLRPDLHDRLYAMCGGIVRDLNSQLIAGNGMTEHAHLLVRFAPDLAPAALAREIKSRSSRWIHETFPDLASFAWQRGYGGFTVSRSVVPEVEEYIRAQQKHHQDMTFEREFETMLIRHGVPFDPRYLFE